MEREGIQNQKEKERSPGMSPVDFPSTFPLISPLMHVFGCFRVVICCLGFLALLPLLSFPRFHSNDNPEYSRCSTDHETYLSQYERGPVYCFVVCLLVNHVQNARLEILYKQCPESFLRPARSRPYRCSLPHRSCRKLPSQSSRDPNLCLLLWPSADEVREQAVTLGEKWRRHQTVTSSQSPSPVATRGTADGSTRMGRACDFC